MKDLKRRFLESPERIYCFAETPDECEKLVNAGARVIQFRNKTADDDTFKAMAQNMLALTRQHEDCLLIINDRIRIALDLGADGIHIGQRDGDPRDAVRSLPPWMIVGISARYPDLAREAEKAGATYVGTGAVFSTSTKPDAPVIGLAGLRAVVESVSVPVVAIGGIGRDNVRDVLKTGARYAAVISAIHQAADMAGAYHDLSAAAGDPHPPHMRD